MLVHRQDDGSLSIHALRASDLLVSSDRYSHTIIECIEVDPWHLLCLSASFVRDRCCGLELVEDFMFGWGRCHRRINMIVVTVSAAFWVGEPSPDPHDGSFCCWCMPLFADRIPSRPRHWLLPRTLPIGWISWEAAPIKETGIGLLPFVF
jgi:hypothetical protein